MLIQLFNCISNTHHARHPSWMQRTHAANAIIVLCASLPFLYRNVEHLIRIPQRQTIQVIVRHPSGASMPRSQAELPWKRRVDSTILLLSTLCIFPCAGEGEWPQFIERVAVLREDGDLTRFAMSV